MEVQQRKRQQYQRQPLLLRQSNIIVIYLLLINFNQITIAVADDNISDNYNNNDILYDNNNNSSTVNDYNTSNERYSVLRLRTNDLNQLLSVKKLMQSSVDLRVSYFLLTSFSWNFSLLFFYFQKNYKF